MIIRDNANTLKNEFGLYGNRGVFEKKSMRLLVKCNFVLKKSWCHIGDLDTMGISLVISNPEKTTIDLHISLSLWIPKICKVRNTYFYLWNVSKWKLVHNKKLERHVGVFTQKSQRQYPKTYLWGWFLRRLTEIYRNWILLCATQEFKTESWNSFSEQWS